MRISKNIHLFIKKNLINKESGSEVYLFGSRADDKKKGGDIDILWLTKEKVPNKTMREFRIKFFKNFGWQKIDIINFRFNDDDVFKKIALSTGIKL